MKFKDRSLKSKEKFADSLMSFANIIHGTVLIGILVFPLTTFISAIFTGTEPFSFSLIIERMNWSKIGLFSIIYFLPIVIGFYVKQHAMNIYDEIEKSAPIPTFKRASAKARRHLAG